MAIDFGGKHGGVYKYYCMSSDLDDLTARAIKDKCWSGSRVHCIDTNKDYMYDLGSNDWYEYSSGGGGGGQQIESISKAEIDALFD